MIFLLINIITISRIPLSFLFYYFVNKDENMIILPLLLFLIIAVTDYIDGKLARKYDATSDIGAKLDVLADFTYILLSSFVLYSKELYPLFMILVIIFKFIEFIITSYLSDEDEKQGRNFLFDKIGRIVAVLFYILPMIILILNKFKDYSIIISIILVITIILSIISSSIRIMHCIKKIRKL